MPKSVFALPYLGWFKFAIRWGVGEDRGSLGMASFMIRSVEAQVLASSSFPMVLFNHKPKLLPSLGMTSNTTLRILSVKGGGGTPHVRNSFFAENVVRKGGQNPQSSI